jgi:hemerythrin-like domain-containing protein
VTRRAPEEDSIHPGGRTDPIARFMLEHDDVLRHISRMNRACKALEAHPDDTTAREQVNEAIEFLAEEIGDHNRREEEALFSVLDRYVDGPTTIMKAEHRLLRKQFTQVRRAYRKFAGSGTGGPHTLHTVELVKSCRALAHTMVNHVHKENQILFPLVRKFMTKDALREVARRIASPEGEHR